MQMYDENKGRVPGGRGGGALPRRSASASPPNRTAAGGCAAGCFAEAQSRYKKAGG